MTNHDHHGTAKTEHCTDLAIEYATGLSTWATLDVDTLVVKGYIMQALHIILAKMAYDTIAASNGDG